MTVFVVAQLSIHDRGAYERYAAHFMPVLDRYGGRLLAAQDGPEVLEGEWGYDRVVLLEFPDKATFERWWQSPEYQEIAKVRIAGAAGAILLVKGLPAAGTGLVDA